MSEATLLSAGAILPAGPPAPGGEHVDPVVARRWAHEALGAPVVRLTSRLLVEARDLEMEVLGFGEGSDDGPVGVARRQALGFPGWALVHDPDHASYALEVVKDLRRGLRRAASKPGHARDAVLAIAGRLERSVPHFLPSFFEEAARGFRAAGNTQVAAQLFEKAREAERVHGLEVDEERRRDAFVEFALAGSVSVRSLSTYAKDMAAAADPASAWRHYRQLCLRRTLGGMPPWASMGRDLGRVAKAAGRKPKDEFRALLLEVLGCPALAKAPRSFWTSSRAAIFELTQASDDAKAALTRVFPEPPEHGTEFYDDWLALLDEAGVIDYVASRSGAAAWLSKTSALVHRGWNTETPEALMSVLERLAPRLVAEGAPVALTSSYDYLHPDLIDRALELGVPVADPGPNRALDLDVWVKGHSKPGWCRDLEFLGRDPRFSKLLDDNVADRAGAPDFEHAAKGRLLESRRRWLLGKCTRLHDLAMPGLTDEIGDLKSRTRPRTFAELPEARPVLEAVRVAPALQRTLKGGLIDELLFPGLDAAIAELAGDKGGRASLSVGGTWPVLVLANRARVIGVGPSGRVLDVELQLKPGANVIGLRYADGQALIAVMTGYERTAFWTGRPDEPFEFHGWAMTDPSAYVVHLPGGGVHDGTQTVRAGERVVASYYHEVFGDGETVWRTQWRGGRVGRALMEVDPRTGDSGRFSWPAFFEDFAAPGKRIDVDRSWLVPAPVGLEGSPLGMADGLVGWTARRKEDEYSGGIEYRGIDGRTFDSEHPLQGLLQLPGSDDFRPVAEDGDLLDPTAQYVASRPQGPYIEGSRWAPPPPYWHAMKPRDPAGSAALRALTSEQAEALLEAARAAGEDEGAVEALAAEVPTLLVGLTDPVLARSCAAVALAAAAADTALGRLTTAEPEEEGAAPRLELRVMAHDLPALGSTYDVSGELGGSLSTLAALIRGEHAEIPVDHDLSVMELLDAAALAMTAALTLDDAQRDRLVALLDALADSGLVDIAGELRRYQCQLALPIDGLSVVSGDYQRWVHGEHGGNQYFAQGYTWDASAIVVERAPSGTFRPLGTDLTDERRFHGGPSGAQLSRVAAAIRERGRLPWRFEDAELVRERTGLSTHQALLALTGFPHLNDSWEQNFLPKPLREALGLKVKDAARARDGLNGVTDSALRRRLLQDMLGEADETLWTAWGSGGDDDPLVRLSNAWNERVGRRVVVDEALIQQAEAELPLDGRAGLRLGPIVGPQATDPLATDGVWTLGAEGPTTTEGAFDGVVLSETLAVICWLFANRPVGDPVRAAIGPAVDRIRARLEHADLAIEGPALGVEWEGREEVVRMYLEHQGGTVVPALSEYYGLPGRDTGDLLITVDWQIHHWVRVGRPGAMDALARLGLGLTDPLRCVELARGTDLDAMVARVADTPVPEGGYEANPALSAPAVVEAVGAARDLDQDASALYLQLLVLPNPTTKAIRQINAWTPKRYSAACAALAARKLVLEAKRSRAGRKHFLPGIWHALGKPLPPIEAWKAALHDLFDEDEELRAPLGQILPTQPLHVMFEAAWRRIENGDVPRYEEVDS